MRKRIVAILLCVALILTLVPVTAYAEQTPLEITKQPVNGYAREGEVVKTSVTAQGDDLRYQWYLKNPGQTKFYESSITGPTYATSMRPEIAGRQVYCVITDGYGKSVTTDTVSLKIPTELKINKQPADGYAAEGESVRTYVSAQGDELQYQWYLKAPGQETFSKSSVKKAAYSFTLTAETSGRQVYCVITDCHGSSVTSETATLRLAVPLKILQQPNNAYAQVGEKVVSTVKVQGDGLQYQWYLKNPGQTKFYESSITGPVYSAAMREEIAGRQIYCQITDHTGKTVTSHTAVLDLPAPIMVIRQPADAYAFLGQVVATSVTAEGTDLQYQWYLKNPGQTKFYKSSVTESRYTARITEENSGRQVYCVITDRNGNTLQTETVTLWRNGVFRSDLVKVKCGGSKDLSESLVFDTTDYLKWESSDTGIAQVSSDGTVTGIQNGTVTVTVTDTASKGTAQCQVKVCNLKQVALTFDDGPSTHTERLLEYLKEKDVPVTFFVVGERMSSYSDTLRQAVADGHEMGYHSYGHQDHTELSDSKIISDFEKSNKLLKEITGAEFTLWRSPGGNYNQRVLNCIALPHIYWSVDTRDWEHRDSDKVYSSVTASSDGDIILMHDLYGTTVDGAIRAVETMLEGDYEFLTVTELLSRDGNPPKPSKNYFNA